MKTLRGTHMTRGISKAQKAVKFHPEAMSKSYMYVHTRHETSIYNSIIADIYTFDSGPEVLAELLPRTCLRIVVGKSEHPAI